MRSQKDFDEVRRLIAAGMNDCAISRSTGVPRTTVLDWRNGPPKRLFRPLNCASHDYSELPSDAYAYLLGLYLGDGCISRMGRVWRLRIALDSKYPGIIESCIKAIDVLMPGQHAHVQPRKPISSSSGSTPSAGRASFRSTAQAVSTSVPSSWNLGSRPTSTPPPKTSSAASSTATARSFPIASLAPRASSPTTVGSPASGITSPITPPISANCSVPPSTPSASPGPRTADT